MTEFLGPTATEASEGAVPPEVSVIIVTYGNETTIDACLDSLAAHTACPYEAVVVDNSPNDATWARIKAFGHEWPGLALTAIRPGHNIGFAAGCNLGARHARGDFLLFLNPDTALDTDITAIFRSFWRDRPRAGLLGPRVCDASGRTVLTCRNLPSLWRIFLDATGLDRLVGAYRLLHFDHASPRQVPQLIGACLFTSRRLFEDVKGFDERFFVYFEEVDLCKRLAESGHELWFVPGASVSHRAGTSCESEAAAATMIAQLRRSRTLYFRKHFTAATVLGLALVNTLEGVAKAAVFTALYLGRGGRFYREKARGFWKVATCFGFWH